MKKHLLWLPAAFIGGTAAFQQPVRNWVNPEQPVNKNIQLAVYANGNYTSDAYKKSCAKLDITVTKIRGSKSTVVWSKIFDYKELKDYPICKNALTLQISIPNVFDSKERIVITYKLTYDSKGSILEMESDKEISKGSKNDQVYIKI